VSHFMQARGEIFQRQKLASARVEETERFQISARDRTVRFICGTYLIAETDRQIDSYLCLTSWKGKFVKYRLSTLHAAGSAATAKRFVGSWIAVLWPAPAGRRAMLGVQQTH